MKRLNHCCCCFGLSNGLKLLGSLEIVGSVISIVLAAISLAGFALMDKEEIEKFLITNFELTSGQVIPMLVYSLIDVVLYCVTASFLLYGVPRRHISSLKYSLYMRYVLVAYAIIGAVIWSAINYNTDLLTSAIGSAIFNLYFAWVTYSFRAELIDSKVSTTES